jgi:hypothetical protein
MGRLKPGATYIYEKANGVTYAREAGSLDREAIGWDADSLHNPDLIEDLKEAKLWGNIHRAAKTNPLLQDALDRAKIIYELSKKDGKK